MSLSRHTSLDALKWDGFLLGKLPRLLERLASLMRVETTALKAPTEMYRAFDRLIGRSENLLNRVDVQCKCNIVEVLLQVI